MNRCRCCWHRFKEMTEYFKGNEIADNRLLCNLKTNFESKNSLISLFDSQVDIIKIIENLLREDVKKSKMIQDLYKKNIELEDRILKIENRDKRKMKKNIIEYLKEKKSSSIFSKWLENIEITRDEFELLANYDYKECILKVLKKLLKNTEIPFCSFTEITNVVYFYTKSEIIEEGWHKMELENIKKLVYQIDGEYTKYYQKWSEENSENEKMQELIIHYLCKINCFDIITSDSKLSQFKKCIYDLTNKP